MKKLTIVPLSPVEIYNAGKTCGPADEAFASRALEELGKIQSEPLIVYALGKEEKEQACQQKRYTTPQ